jgi:hypothetical protein
MSSHFGNRSAATAKRRARNRSIFFYPHWYQFNTDKEKIMETALNLIGIQLQSGLILAAAGYVAFAIIILGGAVCALLEW